MGTMSREEAEKNLRINLVKGLFLYFFAKFAHGPKFEMKPRFYGASEPLKTTLQVITGHNDTSVALHSYFKLMTPYFTMDYKKEELRLKNDLFRPKLRAKSTTASRKNCIPKYYVKIRKSLAWSTFKTMNQMLK